LISLATVITRYTLQMYSDDCGGLYKYAELFSALRETFGIKQQRQELAVEIRDVLKLVESNYLEEQRKLKMIAKVSKEEVDRRKASTHMAIGVVTALALPIVVTATMFGMNNRDVPLGIPFFWCIGIAMTVSGILLIVFVWALYRKPGTSSYEDIIINLGPLPNIEELS